jgi:hypothetical protein
MVGSDEDRHRSMRLGTEDRGWSSTGRILSGRTIERSGDAVCVLHHAEGDEEHEFLILASKPQSTVSRFGPQNRQLRFDDLEHKITATISWFGPQNQVEFDLLVVPQNRWEDEDGVGHVSRSSGLLHLKASQARVSQFCLKTGEGATTNGARDIIMAITWK